MFDDVATCGVQISRKRRKTLLFSFHLGVNRREVRHKIGSGVAFLSRSLCAARISASTTEALLTFPVTWRLNHTRIERTCRRHWEWVNDVFCWTRKRQSFQQSDERWNNGIDCISQHNLPFLVSTSSFGLACDGKTILSGRTAVPVPVWPTFLWSEKAGICLHLFSRTSRRFFFLFFCWENIGDKIRKIILKSAKKRSNDPQFEGMGLATLGCVNLISFFWFSRARPVVKLSINMTKEAGNAALGGVGSCTIQQFGQSTDVQWWVEHSGNGNRTMHEEEL